MGNEVRVVITGKDMSGPAFKSLEGNAKSAEKASKSLADNGVSRAEKGLGRFKEGAAAAGVAIAGVAAVGMGLSKVMGDGIAVSLGAANAQVALGQGGFAKLTDSANKNAVQMGLTTNEFVTAGGQAAMFAKNMGFTQEAAADFGAAMPMLADKLATLSNGQKSTAETSDMLRSAMAGEFDPLQTLGINISAAVVQQKALEIQQSATTKMSNQQAQALAVLSIVQDQSAQATAVMATEQGKAAAKAQAAQAQLREAYQDLSREAVPVLADLTAGTANLAGSWEDAVTGGESFADRIIGIAKVIAPTTNFVDALIGKTKDQGSASKQTNVDIDKLAAGIEDAGQSQEDLAKSTEEATNKIKEQGGVALDTREANRQWQESIDKAADALKENGKTLNDNTEEGRANNAALDDMANAAYDVADAVVAAGGTEADYRASLTKSREALVRQAERFGMTKKAASTYADEVLGIPSRRDTKVSLQTAQARAAARDVRLAIANIRGKTVNVTIRETTYRSAVDIGHDRGEHAVGGIVSPGGYGRRAASGGGRGGLTLVGEGGPELVPLQFGSMVHEAATSRQIMSRSGGGGGGVIVLNVDIGGRRLGQMMIDPLRDEIKNRGGDVQVTLGDNRGRLTA